MHPPGWRNGRRSGLKIRRWQQREGSTPSPGTNKINSLRSVADGSSVSGVYRRSFMLASGRFAMLDNGLEARASMMRMPAVQTPGFNRCASVTSWSVVEVPPPLVAWRSRGAWRLVGRAAPCAAAPALQLGHRRRAEIRPERRAGAQQHAHRHRQAHQPTPRCHRAANGLSPAWTRWRRRPAVARPDWPRPSP